MKFDYIIIGAGSAGSVIAARLTEDSENTVLLLEAGGKDHRFDFRTQMPAALSYPLKSNRYNWKYKTDPEPHMNFRRMDCSRGKGLGGSSLINGMCYIRGNPMDLDNWAKYPGLSKWSYLDCLPYYRKSENRDIGANDYHGGDGPLSVVTPTYNNIIYQKLIDSGMEAGYSKTEDFNGYKQEGFGPMDRTVTSKGRRASTSRAYLDQARSRCNLTILTHCSIEKIIFKDKYAIGVRWIKKNDKNYSTSIAQKEIILCAGAISSPHILQLSGVGEAEFLKSMKIPLVQNLPGVGENLQDHLEMYLQYECKKPISLYPEFRWYRKIRTGVNWLIRHTGIGISNQFEAGGFICSNKKVSWPNIQYHFLPVAINYNGTNIINKHSFQCHVGSMRSLSRGYVKIKSKNLYDPPRILFNYMSNEQDWKELREAIHITRNIVSQKSLSSYCGKEISPGQQYKSDEELNSFIRQYAETAFHPCGTCKMGYDEYSVVDSECRVRFLQHLRVVDASILPQIITGNLNATVIMIAEKISDIIRKNPPLERKHVPYYTKNFKK